jgi:hypothetical protein
MFIGQNVLMQVSEVEAGTILGEKRMNMDCGLLRILPVFQNLSPPP